MRRVRLFVSLYVLFFKLHFSFPYGFSELENERNKIREDVKGIAVEKREDELINLLAHRNLDLKVAKNEAKDEHARAIRAEEQKETYDNILRPLGFRSKVETFVDELYPGRRPFVISAYKALQQILISREARFMNHPRVQVFRKRIQESVVSTDEFLETIRDLCGDVSDKAAQKLAHFAPELDHDDIGGIKNMLKKVGIMPHESKIICVQLVLEPLPPPPKTITTLRTNITTPTSASSPIPAENAN